MICKVPTFFVLHFSLLTEVNTNLYTRLRLINIFNAVLIGVQYTLSFQWTNFGLRCLTEGNTNLYTRLRLINTHPHTASRKIQKRKTCYLAPVFSNLDSQVNIRLLVKKSIKNINFLTMETSKNIKINKNLTEILMMQYSSFFHWIFLRFTHLLKINPKWFLCNICKKCRYLQSNGWDPFFSGYFLKRGKFMFQKKNI